MIIDQKDILKYCQKGNICTHATFNDTMDLIEF